MSQTDLMKKIFHLSSCSTCQRIIKELDLDDTWTFVDIKSDGISLGDLEAMYQLTQSFEALFSRRAMKFRAMGLHEQTLGEKDYKDLILQEYTFLKRPVLLLDNQIFVGNSKKTVAEAKQAIS